MKPDNTLSQLSLDLEFCSKIPNLKDLKREVAKILTGTYQKIHGNINRITSDIGKVLSQHKPKRAAKRGV